MMSEINEWETKYKMLARQCYQTTVQLKIKTDKLKAKDTRNLKKIKRREQTIEKQSNELQEISVVNYHEYNFVLHSYKYMLLNVYIHVCLSVLKLVYM